MTYKELAARLGVRVADLRSLLRSTPGVPEQITRRKPGGDAEEGFSDREAPEDFAVAMLAIFTKEAHPGSSRSRLRALKSVDISDPVKHLSDGAASEGES